MAVLRKARRLVAATLTLSLAASCETPPPAACTGAIAEFDALIQHTSRVTRQPATRAAGMPVEVAAGTAMAVVNDLPPQTEGRRQCYEALLRHAGYDPQTLPYNWARGATMRSHPELPAESPTWIKTDSGCEVGVPFSSSDALRGVTVHWSGACVAGRASGRGELVYTGPGGAARYSGDVRNGLPEGRGVFEDADGDRYEGDFRAGLPDGQGVKTADNGDRWEGDFRVGEPHGRAVFTDTKGNRYEGEYRHGQPAGYGKTFYASGNRYDGEYSNGKRNGRGAFFLANGGGYEGEWRDDKRHGHGILTSPNGDRFEGEFVGDQPVLR